MSRSFEVYAVFRYFEIPKKTWEITVHVNKEAKQMTNRFKNMEVTTTLNEMPSLKKRYIAAMVLSGVGDAMGYKNGNWEFCHSGEAIHKEAVTLGGIEKLVIQKPKWPVSDDTVMHLATAAAYKKIRDTGKKDLLYREMAKEYKKSMHDMAGRAPGPTSMGSCHQLRPMREKGYQIPFDPRGGGCGGAMRSMCIGLQYPRPEDLNELIADSIESGRMTHHHPTGYLGSMTSALFTSYAIQDKPVIQWGADLMKTLPLARNYIKNSGHFVKENLESWDYFENAWKKYLEIRNIESGKTPPSFPENYDIKARDKFYKSLSFSGWGGASGHDAPMIAYDATLGSGDSWIEICKRGILHSGDNDSTGVMAGCWFGARFGFLGVPDNHHKNLEYRGRLEKAGMQFYKSDQCPDDPDSNDDTSMKETDDELSQNSQSCTDSSQLSETMTNSLDIPSTDDEKSSQDTETCLSQTNTEESMTDDAKEHDSKTENLDAEALPSQSNNPSTGNDEVEKTKNDTKKPKMTDV